MAGGQKVVRAAEDAATREYAELLITALAPNHLLWPRRPLILAPVPVKILHPARSTTLFENRAAFCTAHLYP